MTDALDRINEKKKIRGKLVFAFSCRVQPKTCFERSLCRKLFSNYLNRDIIRICKECFFIDCRMRFVRETHSIEIQQVDRDGSGEFLFLLRRRILFRMNFYFCLWQQIFFFLIKNGKRSMFDEDFQVVGVSKRNNSMKIK